MAAGKKYECLTGITEYDRKAGTKKIFNIGDDYTGNRVEKRLKGDVNTGPDIREKTSSSSSAAADDSKEK